MSRDKFKSMHNVFDAFTNRNIFRLISQGHFLGLESPISIGKEANIFSALTPSGKVIVKIYRLESCDFNQMYDYIKEDPRYVNLKGKKRKIIFAWAQREYRNLLKARKLKVRVPKAITLLYNILVMEHIGLNQAAPKLKDAPPSNPAKFLKEIIEFQKKLYKGDMIHTDLSSFNILNHKEHPVLIDFSQTSSTRISRAEEFMDRDVYNVLTYFKKQGLKRDKGKIIDQITKI